VIWFAAAAVVFIVLCIWHTARSANATLKGSELVSWSRVGDELEIRLRGGTFRGECTVWRSYPGAYTLGAGRYEHGELMRIAKQIDWKDPEVMKLEVRP
jgi:hypothetical protein